MASKRSAVEQNELRTEGRLQGQTVNRYLRALAGEDITTTPQRNVVGQIQKIEEDLKSAGPVERLQLLRKRHQLQNPPEDQIIDLTILEKEFTKIAVPYSERTDTPRAVWVDAGVPETVLDKAGIK